MKRSIGFLIPLLWLTGAAGGSVGGNAQGQNKPPVAPRSVAETPMRLRALFCSAAAAVFMFAVNCSCLAASPDAAEAKALLDKAAAYFDSSGVARAFCAFNDANGAFHKGPLYVFAINMDGVYFAHSAASTLIGTSLRDARDATGQPIGILVMEAVATQPSASVEYTWLNYETNKVEKKQTFLKRVDNFVLGVGYYTR